jgi:hypothetical protein
MPSTSRRNPTATRCERGEASRLWPAISNVYRLCCRCMSSQHPLSLTSNSVRHAAVLRLQQVRQPLDRVMARLAAAAVLTDLISKEPLFGHDGQWSAWSRHTISARGQRMEIKGENCPSDASLALFTKRQSDPLWSSAVVVVNLSDWPVTSDTVGASASHERAV